MTNEELMQLMTSLGLHEGGIENWVHDNAWLLVANKAIEIERESCARVCEDLIAKGYQLEGELDLCAAAIRARGNE